MINVVFVIDFLKFEYTVKLEEDVTMVSLPVLTVKNPEVELVDVSRIFVHE